MKVRTYRILSATGIVAFEVKWDDELLPYGPWVTWYNPERTLGM